MALLDSTATEGPYMLDEAAQGAAVKVYFIGAGIPENQISTVEATFLTSAPPIGADTNTASTAAPTLVGINSILRRSVSGIRVVESIAWARMRTDGEVEGEMVFWPPIDTQVVGQAVSLASSMTDVNSHSAFIKKLPSPVYRDIGVVIHHTDFSIHGQPVAYAAYDAVLDPEAGAAVRHFDVTGAEFRLPQEERQQASDPR